jgi:hypothetical protein
MRKGVGGVERRHTVEIHDYMRGLRITDPVCTSSIFEYLTLRLDVSVFARCFVGFVCGWQQIAISSSTPCLAIPFALPLA